jgi:basic salivary proline-rich protein 1/2
MPVHPVTGESLPNPGMVNGLDMPMAGPPMGGPPPGPPMGGPVAGPEMGGQQDRLSQLLEAREMIDQEIAAIIGVPPGTENMDMLPPPPMMPPGVGGPPMQGGPPMGPPMPPMGPQGLLGV